MNHSKTLTEYFQKYSQWTDKEKVHHYGKLYELWLVKTGDVQNMLELGCNMFGGGSLLAFADRFPNAEIIGIDVSFNHIVQEVRGRKSIRLFQGDVYLSETIEQVRKTFQQTFDLIVDDCLHDTESQSKAFELWSPLLADNGLYIIEDVTDLNGLSRKMSVWNHTWDIFLGDTRETKGTVSNSVLLGLQRKIILTERK
jgi:hypothetical protein